MSKPLKKLKRLANKKNFRSLDELYNYVHKYCGLTMMEAVEYYEPQMRRFFGERHIDLDAKAVAMDRVYTYRKPRKCFKPRLTIDN